MTNDPPTSLQDGLTLSIDKVMDELILLETSVVLDHARILDLGCGGGAKTRAIAVSGTNRHVIGMDVDATQFAKQKTSDNSNKLPPNLSFQLAGALDIPAETNSFDLVLLFKSLHHVPDADKALNEIVRVLKPGGKVWISEPLFRGELNEILSLFHDERVVRRAAFEAIVRTVHSGALELVSQTFFLEQRHFDDFADFEKQVVGTTCLHTHEHLPQDDVLKQVRARYMDHSNENGSADFLLPMRVDLLQKPL